MNFKNGEINGKGKEYNLDDKLIFDGENLNGKKWKGIIKIYADYNADLLNFEGELLEGKISGKGKEYDMNGELLFEGEYLDGNKWNGKGKIFDNINQIFFEGDILKGKIWNGNIYDINNNIISEIKNGNGVIKTYSQMNKIKFEGKYINGIMTGKEYDDYGKLVFKGEC